MIKKLSKAKLIGLLSLNFIGILAAVFISVHVFNQYKLSRDILSATAPGPMPITIDFSTQISTGSPMIFGGSHLPPPEHGDIYKQLSDIGVTVVRQDLALPYSVPRNNVTIEDYIANKDNMQDPATWDMTTINAVKNNIAAAKKYNIKVMGIIAYAPRWLTYDGTPNGVVKNYEVFDDIVKKLYKIYRGQLDYIEIGNEPDHPGLATIASSNITREDSYKNYYTNVYKTIKQADAEAADNRKILIGAGVESNPIISKVMATLLADESIRQNYPFDFMSFHTYDLDHNNMLNVYKGYSAKYFNNKMPIFITEWNYESRSTAALPYKSGDKAMIFTANRLIDYLNDPAIGGGNYFNLLPMNVKNQILGPGDQTMGFYLWNDNKVVFLPQAKSWRLLSRSMGLGKGPSKVFKSDVNGVSNLKSSAFINALGQPGMVVSNTSTTSAAFVSFNLNNITTNTGWQRIKFYQAAQNNEGGASYGNQVIYIKNNTFSQRLYVPAQAVVGMLMTNDVTLLEKVQFNFKSL